MSSDTIAAPPRAGVDWLRAEFVLTLLAFLGFLTLPVRITTIYGGLPAHPLFVHVPVVLIPTTVVVAVVFMFKREWFSRYGIALAVVSIVAMSSIFLTMQAGAALRGALHLQGQAAKLISEHSHAAHILAIVYVLFTATLIVAFAAQRISRGMPTGLDVLDDLLSPSWVVAGLRVALVLLAIVAGYMCFRTGDLGAKAVWQGRIEAARAGGSSPLLADDEQRDVGRLHQLGGDAAQQQPAGATTVVVPAHDQVEPALVGVVHERPGRRVALDDLMPWLSPGRA